MSDSVLEALIKGGASAEIIEQYVLTKRQSQQLPTAQEIPKVTSEVKPIRPKRKCTEKQLAALAAGRAKNPNMIAKQKRLEAQKLAEEQKAKEAALARDSSSEPKPAEESKPVEEVVKEEVKA